MRWRCATMATDAEDCVITMAADCPWGQLWGVGRMGMGWGGADRSACCAGASQGHAGKGPKLTRRTIRGHCDHAILSVRRHRRETPPNQRPPRTKTQEKIRHKTAEPLHPSVRPREPRGMNAASEQDETRHGTPQRDLRRQHAPEGGAADDILTLYALNLRHSQRIIGKSLSRCRLNKIGLYDLDLWYANRLK